MSKFAINEIRNKFINYFMNNSHEHISSSPLIPHNDPSLMFVNSGMVQFKNIFTGRETRNYKRAVTSQKCIRAGGKHNDLENVGYTARHHTFFEMLGNFSFGDYFKEEAIYHAWNLLTKEFGLDKSKLYATVYHTDDDAYNHWKKIANFTDDRIIRISTNDNFWSMGDTGPCGPCSEIFYDHGDHIFGGLPGTKDQDGDRFIEIWNMVFMQFEQIDADTRIELPKKSIDTGMGLERIAAVMQNVHDNYDIDLFKEMMASIEYFVKVKPIAEAKFSYRVIADHIRASAFLIADGIMPSNEGRGYVLRRIIRRAARHAYNLGAKEPLLHKLLPKLIELMGETYSELNRARDFTQTILKQEESQFNVTLERGLKILDEEIANIVDGGQIDGDVAFKLYDTFGFPLDLTQDILKQKNMSVDLDGFNQKMALQKEMARKSWLGSSESKTDEIWFDIKSEFGSTEFLGYNLNESAAKILALIDGTTKTDKILNIGQEFLLISNQTPFYGESGGQKGDIGVITSSDFKIQVISTMKYLGSIIVHKCILLSGVIKIGDSANFAIDVQYRNNLRIHHSATHLLQAALQEIIGKHVAQKGSLVAYDRLRFDISHPVALSQDEIESIENKVNDIIRANSEVQTKLMRTEDAIEAGSMALFGEKYDDEVRVVSMGGLIENNKRPYSLELCGGTHVRRTGDIGCFKIISESAVAMGVRRIEAVCGEFALKLAKDNEALIRSMCETLKSSKSELSEKITNLLSANKLLEKQLNDAKIAALELSTEELNNQTISVDGINLLYKLHHDIDTKILREAALCLSNRNDNLIVIYVGNIANKLSIITCVSKNISDKFHAGEIAKKISLFLGGTGGGGQSTIAQAGALYSKKLKDLESQLKVICNN